MEVQPQGTNDQVRQIVELPEIAPQDVGRYWVAARGSDSVSAGRSAARAIPATIMDVPASGISSNTKRRRLFISALFERGAAWADANVPEFRANEWREIALERTESAR